MSDILYNKVFTGEIPPVVINKQSPFLTSETDSNFKYQELPLIKWREIVLKHLPPNVNLSTVEAELKLEYLHFDYLIPSRVVVPSSAIPVYTRRESDLVKQTKTLEFKNKYNQNDNYAFEFRLLKCYDPLYTLDSVTPYVNQIPYNAELNYPIADLIYNNRLPGFMDLMPYLTRQNAVTFADVKQELKIMIIPKLSDDDYIVCCGGYSGSVTYELLPTETQITQSRNYFIGIEPIQILEFNPKRLGFYLTNLGTQDIFYSFSSISGGYTGLKLKGNETLIYENERLIINNQVIDTGNFRYILGLPLWVKGSQNIPQQISIEEISYL